MLRTYRGPWLLDVLTPLVGASYRLKPHLQYIVCNSREVTVIYKNPYTCVVVELETPETIVIGRGFAKCNTRLDEFDSFIGIAIALSRAAKDINCQLKEELCAG